MIKICLLFISLSLFSEVINAQKPNVLKLKSRLKSSKKFNEKLKICIKIGDFYQDENIDSSFAYFYEGLKISQKLKNPIEESDLLNKIGWNYYIIGNSIKALEFYQKSIKVCQKIVNAKTKKTNVAASLTNIGVIYDEVGEYDKAIRNYSDALKTHLEIGNKFGESICLGNIAISFSNKGFYNKAIEYHLKAYKIDFSLNDIEGQIYNLSEMARLKNLQSYFAQSLDYSFKALRLCDKIDNNSYANNIYQNIGISYKNIGEIQKAEKYYKKALSFSKKIHNLNSQCGNLTNLGNLFSFNNKEKALYYYQKALIINEKTNNLQSRSVILGNIGNINCYIGDSLKVQNKDSFLFYYHTSLMFHKKALKITKELEYKEGISIHSNNLGLLYLSLNKLDSSFYFLMLSHKNAFEMKSNENLMEVYLSLFKYYAKLNDHKNALKFHLKYINLKDETFNEQNRKKELEHEMQYQYDKKSLKDSLQVNEERKFNKLKIREEKSKQYLLMFFLVILAIIVLIIFNRFKITNKQKIIIHAQKTEVEKAHNHLEEKNKEITDSITYAKRIQSAILPQPKLVKEYFKDSFILYKPKDIVAGDFYWFEVIDDLIFFAAADCTGHGVPGALVSVVCHNALNRSVKEFNLKKPSDILDKTREIVVSEFEKSDEDVKDGMDISLCALNLNTNTLNWSGAHNPLWILRNQDIIEIKADKQPIGKFTYAKSFTNHEITLIEKDEIYLSTDGFQDQFGGEKGKKFKASQLKEILILNTHKTMEEKLNLLDQTFETWKVDLEQVDDVCIIGVRL